MKVHSPPSAWTAPFVRTMLRRQTQLQQLTRVNRLVPFLSTSSRAGTSRLSLMENGGGAAAATDLAITAEVEDFTAAQLPWVTTVFPYFMVQPQRADGGSYQPMAVVSHSSPTATTLLTINRQLTAMCCASCAPARDCHTPYHACTRRWTRLS